MTDGTQSKLLKFSHKIRKLIKIPFFSLIALLFAFPLIM